MTEQDDEFTESQTSSMRVVRLCSVGDVPDGEARRFDVGDERIAVVHLDGEWYAIGDECSHADYSLAEGEVDDLDCALECRKHGSLFSLKTGEPLTLPATKAVPVYKLEVGESEVGVRLRSVAPGSAAEPKGASDV